MQKSTFFQRIVKDWGFESLVWIAVLVLLTISNISTDISLSVELAALLTGGMLFLSILNRYLLLPYMLHKRRMWLYLLFSSCLIIGFIYLFYDNPQYGLSKSQSFVVYSMLKISDVTDSGRQ